jgi:nitrogen fixation protein NifU and related proteins
MNDNQDYSEKVKDHFFNPRNVGVLDAPDAIGKAGNPRCGDVMELQLKIENNVITDAKFRTMGCGAAIATSSMITELIKGKTVEEALKISNKDVAGALDGLPQIKMHCSVLAAQALKAAIENFYKK